MSSQNKRIAPYIIAGTATGTAGTVDLTHSNDGRTLADYITIQNTDGANNLLFNFDGGSTFATIKPGNSFDLEWRLTNITLKSSGASTTYEIVAFTGKHFRSIYGGT